MVDDAEKVIATMGLPADIIDEDEAPQKARKLYRDPDKRVLGGRMTEGMAAYRNISPLLSRVCFVIRIFFIVYLILWIAVPKAKTAKQKLEILMNARSKKNTKRSKTTKDSNTLNAAGKASRKHCLLSGTK